MPDEALRELERAAKDDPVALTRLTTERLRRKDGVVLMWVAYPRTTFHLGPISFRSPEEGPPAGPEHSVPVALSGYASGGETVMGGGPQPPPTLKKAWALACLDLRECVFGFSGLPGEGGRQVNGPMLLDLASGRLTGVTSHLTTHVSVGVSVDLGRLAQPPIAVGDTVRHRSLALGVGTVVPPEEDYRDGVAAAFGWPLVQWDGGESGRYAPDALERIR